MNIWNGRGSDVERLPVVIRAFVWDVSIIYKFSPATTFCRGSTVSLAYMFLYLWLMFLADKTSCLASLMGHFEQQLIKTRQ